MTAEQLLTFVTNAGFIFIFISAAIEAIRRPRPAAIDTAVFFGAIAAIVLIGVLTTRIEGDPPQWVSFLVVALLMALPYLMLRLIGSFTVISRNVHLLAGAGLVASIIAYMLAPLPTPSAVSLGMVAYFVAVEGYVTWRLGGALRNVRGVTRRRLQAIATGSALLGFLLLIAGVRVVAPEPAAVWQGISSVASLACGFSFFLGFAAPKAVRRYWLAPELLHFMDSTLNFGPRQSIPQFAEAVEQAVAGAVSAPNTVMLLVDEERDRLYSPRFPEQEPGDDIQIETMPMYRVLRTQRSLVVTNAQKFDPLNADVYSVYGARSLLIAPMTVAGQRFGVLIAYADRTSVFADDDLSLIEMLAREIAVRLHRRELAESANRVRLQEEATRLREEFLAAAAHDLRTPLTILLAQGQLLQRHMRNGKLTEDDAQGIDGIVTQAQRIRRLTDDLLDAARAEASGFVGDLLPTDLVALTHEIVGELAFDRHHLAIEGDSASALVDPDRLQQVLRNLLENAIKFSPQGGTIGVKLAQTAEDVRVTVSDEGVGVAPKDIPHVFERFYRGTTSGGGSFPGMGVGLFLCKRIIDEHGGRIWVESGDGPGTRFHISLPVRTE